MPEARLQRTREAYRARPHMAVQSPRITGIESSRVTLDEASARMRTTEEEPYDVVLAQ